MKPLTDRNEEIVALRDSNPKKYSFGYLGKKYKKARSTIQEIYWREKAKMGDETALSHPIVARKYPTLFVS